MQGSSLGIYLRQLLFALRQHLTRRKARALDAGEACVACGSTETSVVQGANGEEQRACHACGYVGRADGGGELTAAELDGLHDDDGGPFGWGN